MDPGCVVRRGRTGSLFHVGTGIQCVSLRDSEVIPLFFFFFSIRSVNVNTTSFFRERAVSSSILHTKGQKFTFTKVTLRKGSGF